MATIDFTSSILALRVKLTKPLLALTVVLIILGWLFAYWVYAIAAIVLGFTVFINGLYVIMPGHAGYKITLGKMANESFSAGYGWMIPFISAMTEVDITTQTHQDTNTMKNANRRDITLTYVLTWRLNANNVHTLHATIGEKDYIGKALCPQLDACMSNIIAQKSYEDINKGLKTLAAEIMTDFELLYNKTLFKEVNLNIVDVKFDKDYEEAVAEAAKIEMERKIVEEKAAQLQISAKAQAEALITKAEAEAKALQLKGATENEIQQKLGDILKDRPELLKKALAENFPKVYGGNSIMNLNDLLGM